MNFLAAAVGGLKFGSGASGSWDLGLGVGFRVLALGAGFRVAGSRLGVGPVHLKSRHK